MSDIVAPSSPNNSNTNLLNDGSPPQKRVRHLRENLHIMTSLNNHDNQKKARANASLVNSVVKSIPESGSHVDITPNSRAEDSVLGIGRKQNSRDSSPCQSPHPSPRGTSSKRGRKRGRPPGRPRKNNLLSQTMSGQRFPADYLLSGAIPSSPSSPSWKCLWL